MTQAAAQLEMVQFKAGSVITVEGKTEADRFFIIRQGKISIAKETEVIQEEGGNVFGPGDFFGVVECMASRPRIETVSARTDVSLIGIRKDQFGVLIMKNALIAMKIIRQFSKKLRYFSDAIARLSLKGKEVEADPEKMFEVAKFYEEKNNPQHACYAYKKYLQHLPQGRNAAEAQTNIEVLSRECQLEEPSSQGLTRLYKDGSVVFVEHEPGEEVFIIQQGKVNITKILSNQEVLLAGLHPGDIFGEMAILENKPRSATAIASGGGTLMMVVNKSNFEPMVQQKPQIAAKLIQLLSERIWVSYKQLANLTMFSPVGRMFDTLKTQLEKNRIALTHNKTYTFDFDQAELVKMVGLTEKEAKIPLHDMFENKKLQVVNGKIQCTDLEEIEKQAQYFKKMDQMERTRRKSQTPK